jgi:uncharacterized integral membrane protein
MPAYYHDSSVCFLIISLLLLLAAFVYHCNTRAAVALAILAWAFSWFVGAGLAYLLIL